MQARFTLQWPGFKLDVDLALPGLGITALFGPSGSGKTTLLRCIAGLAQADQGYFSLRDQIWQDAKHSLPTYKRPLAYVFQEASLFPHLTVLGNLRYGLRRSKEPEQISLEHCIELLGIGHLLARKPEYLSGGERQRVAIARALAVKPRLLLMDEPLAALDMARKQEILPYLEQLRQELKMPILYVSHAADEVARLADHLVVLQAGKVLANGPLGETLANLSLPIRLGEDVGTVLEGHIGALDPQWYLARVDFGGGSLWTRDRGFTLGRKVRLRVLARDVSIAINYPGASSIQNVLQGQVDAIGDEEHPALQLVRLKVGEVSLISRITKRAAAEMAVNIGQQLWVQVKSVALIE
jgi:molybdate transport system ATP-binding protein